MSKQTWARSEYKNEEGGMNKKGVEQFNKENPGSKLQTGVKWNGKGDGPSRERQLRWANWATRFYTNPKGPLKDDNGKPTRLALMATAWGVKPPSTVAQAKAIAARGRAVQAKWKERDSQRKLSFRDAGYSTLSTSSDQPLVNDGGYIRVPIVRLGSWPHPDPTYGEVSFEQQDFEDMMRNFQENHTGYIPALYFGHPLQHPDAKDGEPRQGTLSFLSQEGDELIGYFNPVSQEVIDDVKANKYGYSSAELYRDAVSKKTRQPIGMLLTAVALTNKPFVPDLSPVTYVPGTHSFSDDYECPERAIDFVIRLTEEDQENKSLMEQFKERFNALLAELLGSVQGGVQSAEGTPVEGEPEPAELSELEQAEDDSAIASLRAEFASQLITMSEQLALARTEAAQAVETLQTKLVEAQSVIESLRFELDLTKIGLSDSQSKLTQLSDLAAKTAVTELKNELVDDGIPPATVDKYTQDVISKLALSDSPDSVIAALRELLQSIPAEERTLVNKQIGQVSLSDAQLAEINANPISKVVTDLEEKARLVTTRK